MSTFGILFFLFLGGLAFLAFSRIISFAKSRKTGKRFLVLLCLSVILIGFGLTWSYTSFQENEPYAAYMGLIVFGGLGIVLGGLGLWNVMDSRAAPVDPESGGSPLAISWKQAVTIVLMVVFTVTLPAAWLLKSITDIVSDRERVSTFLHENLLSDRALPGAIRKAMEYEAWLTPIDEPLQPRIVRAAISGIDPENWNELFGYIAPEEEREALLDEVITSLYSWIHGDDAYPSLTIQTGAYLEDIESHAENLVLWIFKSFPIPACSPEQIRELERGDQDDIQELVLCKPPESLQVRIAPLGGTLIKKRLAEKNPPNLVNVTERMKEKIPPEKLSATKQRIRTLFLVGSAVWIVPVAFLLIGLLLAARSLSSVVAWLSWPLTIAGLFGVIIACRLPALSFLHSVPKDMPEGIPGAAVGIGRKLGIELALMLENAMFTPFLIMALVGGFLLVLAYGKKIPTIKTASSPLEE